METAAILARAQHARQLGQLDDAERVLRAALSSAPHDPQLLNALGLVLLERQEPDGAAESFRRAIAVDRRQPLLWINLASALAAVGDLPSELSAIEQALALDPLMMPALVRKALVLESLGRSAEAVRAFRGLLQAAPDEARLPPAMRDALAHGRALVRREDRLRAEVIAPVAAAVRARFPDADLRRADAYAGVLTGQRLPFRSEPTGALFPYLPAIEFFDREMFPWFGALESATGTIGRELRAVWNEPGDGLVPYVAYAPGTPVNQWADLNHSPKWSAFFLWKDGVPVRANIDRCPETAELLASLPLLDIEKRGPTVMFSILAPRTRIPPHTGTTNIRATVHLPLVVPAGCGFRVGSEARTWREGEAWAFDDTIEHEAWNDSDQPRVILIVDTWNPLLSEAERALVRETTAALA